MLSGKQIRALLRDAGPRLGDYYRTELARLTGAPTFEEALSSKYSEVALRSGFVQFLKSNLRAIPIFGTAFGLAVLDHAPLDRAVGIGEERSSTATRAAVLAGLALALIVAGAAGERVLAGARASGAASPAPMPLAIATPLPAATEATAQPRPKATAKPNERRVMARVELPQPTAVPQAPAASEAAPALVAPSPATPSPPPPKGAGSAVVEVTAAPATPSPEPTDLDTEDMPEAYSDATPMPQQSLTPADVPQHAIRVSTPKPSPKPRGWVHRTIMHLDPFKPGGVPHSQ